MKGGSGNCDRGYRAQPQGLLREARLVCEPLQQDGRGNGESGNNVWRMLSSVQAHPRGLSNTLIAAGQLHSCAGCVFRTSSNQAPSTGRSCLITIARH